MIVNCFFFSAKLIANNLYGYAMSQRLPIGEYKWLSSSALEQNFNTTEYQKNTSAILNLKDDSDDGYIFEVDLHYPPELHDTHNDFPFCPEKRTIPGITKKEKLLLTFYDKEKYIVHYQMLKMALEHGLVLKKVHRVLQFKQTAWLKPYIDLNTKHRALAKNEFEKSFYKLLNNAVYGKTMENLRLRSDIRLISKWDGCAGGRKLIAYPNFKRCKVFDENLAAVELHKTHILMNKPIIIGMCVLEMSKVLMYSFLYNYLKPKYGQNVQNIYTDTDSFILEIKTPDVYADIRDDPEMFDTWDYPEKNIYGIVRQNNKVPGKFKDELAGVIATEVVGLRSKCYSLRTIGDKKRLKKNRNKMDEKKKIKGIKKSVVKNKISFDDYYNCIKNNCIEMRKQYSIRSQNHNLYTISTEKVALNPFDDKRYIIKPDGIETLAWGHHRIDSEKLEYEYQNIAKIRDLVKKMKKKDKKKTIGK